MYSDFIHSIWPFIAASVLFVISGFVHSRRNSEKGEKCDTFASDIRFDIAVVIVITLIMHCILVRYANLVWDEWYVTLLCIPLMIACFAVPGGFYILNLVLSGLGAADIPPWMNAVALVLGCMSVLIYVILIRAVKRK